ncbi:MAG: hypothetical protein R2867_20095 [Caldilineaceae bacterium]
MRILLTIPHFFNPVGNGRYGSTQPDPKPRLAALTQALRNLYTLYAGAQEHWYRGDRLHPHAANQAAPVTMDIVICTCRDLHLLDQLVLPPDLYTHQRIDCEPLQLGFECHTVLRERLGDYDLYGYMEDDLILHDPNFFHKLCYFTQRVGVDHVLQPNRFERYGSMSAFKKVYIDFAFDSPEAFAARNPMPIVLEQLGWETEFCIADNAHAGAFFLTQAQMAHWTKQAYFGDRAATYVGPLESAATLGLLRTFKVYKPAPRNANFLEIEHYGQIWSRQLAAVRFGKAPSTIRQK